MAFFPINVKFILYFFYLAFVTFTYVTELSVRNFCLLRYETLKDEQQQQSKKKLGTIALFLWR